MAGELREIQKRLKIAAVYVTHDQETASLMSDRIAVMEGGRIVQVGSPRDIYFRPQSRFVAEFVGDMNFLRVDVTQSTGNGTHVRLFDQTVELGPTDFRAGDFAFLAVRPDDVRIASERSSTSIVKATQSSVQFSGGTFLYRLKLPDGSEVLARRSTECPFTSEVWIDADRGSIRLLRN
jgi:ABC-type Fe3+/spermidine/putrescine transport system ATPase subunit